MLPGLIAFGRYAGPLSAVALRSFAAAGITSNRSTANGFLADYRAAIFTCTEREWWDAVTPLHPLLHRNIPGAYVASAGLLDLLRSHAFRMSQAGFVRRVFLHPGQAYDWLLGQRDVV